MSVVAAISSGKALLIGIASGVALVLVVGASLAALRRPRRARGPDIPPAMRPGPSDPDLEKPVLEKLYAAGLLLVVIMALWIPGVFLRENVANKSDTQNLLT